VSDLIVLRHNTMGWGPRHGAGRADPPVLIPWSLAHRTCAETHRLLGFQTASTGFAGWDAARSQPLCPRLPLGQSRRRSGVRRRLVGSQPRGQVFIEDSNAPTNAAGAKVALLDLVAQGSRGDRDLCGSFGHCEHSWKANHTHGRSPDAPTGPIHRWPVSQSSLIDILHLSG
jgi:hypothetical protein